MQHAIIEGLANIGAAVGRSHNTLRTWQRIHGFPMVKLPNGNWATSPSLIDKWLLARGQQRGN